MYKQVVKANGTEVTIRVPEEMAGKELQVTVEETVEQTKDREKLWAEAEAFFNSIAVKTKGFKFNREEANER